MEGTGTSGRPSGPHTHAARSARTTFHPSVVLLLDDEGERAAAYLSELLAGLPPAVQSWVELLPASDALDPANEAAFESALAAALARVTMVHLRDDVRRAGYQVGDATPLVLLVGHTISPALLAAALAAQHVTDRGFPQTIRLALLSDSRPHDLDAARALDDLARAQPWDRLLGWFAPGAAEAEPPVALCLLYQDYDERSWHWNLQEADVARMAGPGKFSGSRVPTGPLRGRTTGPLATDVAWASSTTGPLGRSGTTGPLGRGTSTGPLRAGAVLRGGPSGPLAGAPDGAEPLPAFEPEDVRYAVAEAAFALIASGLVDEPEFREQVRLNMPTAPGGGGEAERRFATLATSRLAFPRAHAEAACGQYEGAALLADWLRAIEREAPPRATTRGGRRTSSNLTRGEDAIRFLRSLRGEIEDSEEMAFRRVSESSPPLSAEGISQLYGFERTEIDPARIFAPFRGRSIAREMAATGERVPGALRALDERARVRFRRWRQDAGQVWGEAFAEREREVAEHVEATLLATPAGIGRARAYLSELRQKLTWMRERQDDRERHRAAAFEQFQRKLAFEANDIMGAVRGARAYAPAAITGPVAPAQVASAPVSSVPRATTAPLPLAGAPDATIATPSAPTTDAARPAQASAWLNDTAAPALPDALGPFDPAARGAPLDGQAGVDSDTLARQALIANALANAPTRPLYDPDAPDAATDAASAAYPLTITGALPVIATGLSALPAQDLSADAPSDTSQAASADATDGPDATGATGTTEPEIDPTVMPERLQRLIAQLGAQLGTEDGLLPSYGTVLAALVMLLPFLAYAAVALAPVLPWRLPVWHIGASQLPLNVVLVGIVLALAVGVPTVMIYRQQAERVGRLRRLLVGAYVRWWAELCGRAEDTLRREGVQHMRAAVEERLAAVAGFEERLRQAQGELSAEAARMESALTAGPQGRRDVFAIGGKRFPGVRMAHLHQRVQARRAGDPLDPQHADELALGTALRGRLRTADAGLLDLSSEEIAGRVAEFGTEVCRPYLAGELVTVLPAIHLGWDDDDAERVPLGTLIERATPLYRPIATDSPRRLVALAAPEELALRDAPAAAPTLRLVTTPSPEWLLVAHLLSHGRPRWWRRALIEPGHANGAAARPASAVPTNGHRRNARTGGNA